MLEPGQLYDPTEASQLWEFPAHPSDAPELPHPEPSQPADLATDDDQVIEDAAAGPGSNAPGGTAPFCWACGRVFKRSQELIRHLKVHMPKRICPFKACAYKWDRPAKINAHIIQVHGNELHPYVSKKIPKLRGRAVVDFVDALEFNPYGRCVLLLANR